MKLLRAAGAGALSALCALGLVACNLGPFPDFLERLDPLDPVQGDAKGWMSAGGDRTQVLILSEGGQFLLSTVFSDASVEAESGRFEIDGNRMIVEPAVLYEFPKESGPVSGRDGAQTRQVNPSDHRSTHELSLDENRLTIEGWGTFLPTRDYVEELDLETTEGRGCLLQFIQVSVRTIQSRIVRLGSGGTVIYHNNLSSFAGFLSGEQTIVVENLLSPDTTLTYRDFQDFPEVELDGSYVSHVNTSGNGSLDEAVSFTIFHGGFDDGVGAGGAGGAAGDEAGEREVFARGRLIYGTSDPIVIERADVVGGSYGFELSYPLEASEQFPWQFLQDIDLTECSIFGAD